jgi:hypothetical protein
VWHDETTVSTKAEMLATLTVGLVDQRAHELRLRVAHEIPQRLSENALRLSIHYLLESNAAAGTGFATTTEMAAELGVGAAQLFTAERWYAGAALVRQLIECNYLLTLMAEDRAEAAGWMTSSHADIVAKFMPRHMRQRSVRNFRQSEYEVHCDRGGHPNPAGRHLLQHWSISEPQLHRNGHWLDLAEHLADIWRSFVDGLPLYDPRMDPESPLYRPQRLPDGGIAIADLLAAWQSADPVARRLGELSSY